MEMKKYALVEWTNEADAGSYSVVNSEWILGYTPEMYLIEWREGQGRKKPPPGGWPMGEAKILKTSDKETELKKSLHDMTSLKVPQTDLVVTGKRRRIPKKRLYESEDETDTDVGRSSSGDEKKRTKGSKKPGEGSQPSSPTSSPRKASGKRSPGSAEGPSQSHTDEDQDQDQDQADGPSQDTFHETSSDRDGEDSTDDMLTDGHVTEMDNAEEGSDAEYPPEYELSELEKLRLEVRGLRDEIMLLRHQVCKELPKVHAIALKALGMQTNNLNHHHPQQQQAQSIKESDSGDEVKPEPSRRSARPRKRTFATKPTRPVHGKSKTVLKKEAEIFRQKVQLERATGKARVVLSPTKVPLVDHSPSTSPSKKQTPQAPNQVEIHPGTGVFVDQEAWDKLNELDQPTAFARRMLPYVFSIETLLTSNLRGGKSTRDSTAEHKKALDEDRVDAIYKTVITKFPDASYCDIGQAINEAVNHKFPYVRHCDIGQAINGRLSNMRYQTLQKSQVLSLPSQLPASLLYRHDSLYQETM